MQSYAIQKALQALEELGSRGDLKIRVWNAWGHLGFVDSDHFLQDAHEIKRAFDEASKAFKLDGDLPENLLRQSEAIQVLIFRIAAESGYIKAIEEQNDLR